MTGVAKIIADVPATVKEQLKDIAHIRKSNMTQEIIRLIEQAAKKELKK